MFNIITRRTLLHYCRLNPAAAVALQQWYAELLNENFGSFNELKAVYAAVSLVGDDRVVFNVVGNKFRLVVRFAFAYKTIQIKWFGTHSEYDKIDVAAIKFRTP